MEGAVLSETLMSTYHRTCATSKKQQYSSS